MMQKALSNELSFLRHVLRGTNIECRFELQAVSPWLIASSCGDIAEPPQVWHVKHTNPKAT